MMKTFTIGQLAKKARTSAVTIRYYEKLGLLPKAQRSVGGYHLYTEDSLQQLIFISNAKTAGFTLTEIKDLIYLQQQKDTTKRDVKIVVEKKSQLITQKIEALQKTRAILQELADSCDGEGNLVDCSILNQIDSGLTR